jgi:hypothetical protein
MASLVCFFDELSAFMSADNLFTKKKYWLMPIGLEGERKIKGK